MQQNYPFTINAKYYLCLPCPNRQTFFVSLMLFQSGASPHFIQNNISKFTWCSIPSGVNINNFMSQTHIHISIVCLLFSIVFSLFFFHPEAQQFNKTKNKKRPWLNAGNKTSGEKCGKNTHQRRTKKNWRGRQMKNDVTFVLKLSQNLVQESVLYIFI